MKEIMKKFDDSLDKRYIKLGVDIGSIKKEELELKWWRRKL